MDRIAVDDLDDSIQAAAVMRHLTEPLGTTDFAMNYYELEPGDSFAFAYHSHEVQEEVFYVIEGTATFETESGPVEVGPDEAIRFGREEFQRGWNRGDERVVALALGAPLEYGDQVKLRYCPECAEETDNELDRADDEEAVVACCKECGTETGRWYRGSMPGEVP
ncbi:MULTISPECIES: cupin domain-containing protein [Halolamina]|uniref:Cupin domain-containing protein n=1 Tax=Halolamina pelagica TaxID=699431 RepID=A0A1I5RRP2_9EURY|nr:MULTISPECIES: cupin domain-containing protein [Halolamina]NHX35312.1 cupin domain-containing protein [Halolamina sp. R1-12]SFP61212.1 Cupin domain-containing protein [Halolamina pelagica]